MSSNLERLCQVDIEISRPIANNANFDTILIVGPPPMSGDVVPAVTLYGSANEATEVGYDITGDNADPVGTAIRVAFSQSPKPSQVYVATRQLSERAVAAGVMIAETNAIIKELVGTKDNLTGCMLDFDAEYRKLQVVLEGPVADVKNTGIIDALNALIAAGYTVLVRENEITGVTVLTKLQEYKDIAAMTAGSADVPVVVTVRKEGEKRADNVDVSYAVVVSYPDPSAALSARSGESTLASDGPIDSPETEYEEIGDTLARAAETDGWYVICPAGVPEELYEEMAEWTETQEKMFAFTTMSEENPVTQVYYRSFGYYGREYIGQPDDELSAANYNMHVAACAKILRYDPGSETWVHKQLATVLPSNLKTAQAKSLESKHLNYMITVASRNITMLGQTCAGEWIDLIRFRDWLKNDMQVRVVNLMVTRKKIPYTDGGIALVQNQMIASLKAGVAAGGIAPDEYDEDGNLNPAFVTHVPIAANITATQKASRILTDVSFEARIAGAIHMVEIGGNLTYDNLTTAG